MHHAMTSVREQNMDVGAKDAATKPNKKYSVLLLVKFLDLKLCTCDFFFSIESSCAFN